MLSRMGMLCGKSSSGYHCLYRAMVSELGNVTLEERLAKQNSKKLSVRLQFQGDGRCVFRAVARRSRVRISKVMSSNGFKEWTGLCIIPTFKY